MEEIQLKEYVARITPRRGHVPFSSPRPCQVSVRLLSCVVLDQVCKLTARESAADREMVEESHRSCHSDPREGLAGRAFLLCSGIQGKPSLWGWLGMAVCKPILHGRKSAYREQRDFKATTPDMQFLVHMLPPSCCFPLTPPLLQVLGG